MRDREDCASVCCILAAQMREALTRFDRFSSDLDTTLSQLETKVIAADSRHAAEAVQGTLDEILFVQAQERDLVRQMMEAVTQALSLLPDRIDAGQLVQLYVSDAQRAVHCAALAMAPGPGDAG